MQSAAGECGASVELAPDHDALALAATLANALMMPRTAPHVVICLAAALPLVLRASQIGVEPELHGPGPLLSHGFSDAVAARHTTREATHGIGPVRVVEPMDPGRPRYRLHALAPGIYETQPVASDSYSRAGFRMLRSFARNFLRIDL